MIEILDTPQTSAVAQTPATETQQENANSRSFNVPAGVETDRAQSYLAGEPDPDFFQAMEATVQAESPHAELRQDPNPQIVDLAGGISVHFRGELDPSALRGKIEARTIDGKPYIIMGNSEAPIDEQTNHIEVLRNGDGYQLRVYNKPDNKMYSVQVLNLDRNGNYQSEAPRERYSAYEGANPIIHPHVEQGAKRSYQIYGGSIDNLSYGQSMTLPGDPYTWKRAADGQLLYKTDGEWKSLQTGKEPVVRALLRTEPLGELIAIEPASGFTEEYQETLEASATRLRDFRVSREQAEAIQSLGQRGYKIQVSDRTLNLLNPDGVSLGMVMSSIQTTMNEELASEMLARKVREVDGSLAGHISSSNALPPEIRDLKIELEDATKLDGFARRGYKLEAYGEGPLGGIRILDPKGQSFVALNKFTIGDSPTRSIIEAIERNEQELEAEKPPTMYIRDIPGLMRSAERGDDRDNAGYNPDARYARILQEAVRAGFSLERTGARSTEFVIYQDGKLVENSSLDIMWNAAGWVDRFIQKAEALGFEPSAAATRQAREARRDREDN